MSCLVDIHRFTMINARSKFRHLLRKGFDLLHPSAAGAGMVMGTWTFRSRKAVDFVCGELDSWIITGRSGSRLIQLCGKGVKPCALIKEVRIVGKYRTQNPVLTRDTPKLAIILPISLILGDFGVVLLHPWHPLLSSTQPLGLWPNSNCRPGRPHGRVDPELITISTWKTHGKG